MIGYIILFVVLAVIAAGLWFLERHFAAKPGKHAGLGAPGAFLALSVFSIVQSIPQLAETMQEQGYGLGGLLATILFSFLVTNIPTLWVYFVYYRTRRQLGMEYFPFRASGRPAAAPKQTAKKRKQKKP